jgi:hypothetical protein
MECYYEPNKETCYRFDFDNEGRDREQLVLSLINAVGSMVITPSKQRFENAKVLNLCMLVYIFVWQFIVLKCIHSYGRK